MGVRRLDGAGEASGPVVVLEEDPSGEGPDALEIPFGSAPESLLPLLRRGLASAKPPLVRCDPSAAPPELLSALLLLEADGALRLDGSAGYSRTLPLPASLREAAAAYRVRTLDSGAKSLSRDWTNPAGEAWPPWRLTALEAGLVGEDPGFLRALETAAAVAPHDVPVLIQGETGTGKGLLARFIHALRDLGRGPFVAVNCAALPDQLVESLLFGHRKGSFTGAGADQPGKFELADGGTLFLDEVGELSASVQPKLLKALEEGVVEPIGARQPKPVRVRFIAATHRRLAEEVKEKRFREDLYYRLSFAIVSLPPLRERPGDIPALAKHILERYNRKLDRPCRLAASALARLQGMPWKGNVRDLENVLGRSLLLGGGDVLGPDDLRWDGGESESAVPTPPALGDDFSMEQYLSRLRRDLIRRALAQAGGSQSGAARLLGISPQAVHRFVHAIAG